MFEQERLGDLFWKFPHSRDAIFPERMEGAMQADFNHVSPVTIVSLQ